MDTKKNQKRKSEKRRRNTEIDQQPNRIDILYAFQYQNEGKKEEQQFQTGYGVSIINKLRQDNELLMAQDEILPI